MKLVYVAGKYRGATAWEVEQHIRAAEAVAYRVAQCGAYPVTPHANTRGYFEHVQPDAFWLDATLELMRRCDAVVLCNNWADSAGAKAEYAEAVALKLPIFAESDLYGSAPVSFARWVRGEQAA